METLVVGSRGSQLALRQTQQVVDELQRLWSGLRCIVRVIRTSGDIAHQTPLSVIGGTGVFVREIESALARGEIDAAVHSAKDMPSDIPEPLTIAAFCEREDPSDALVSCCGTLEEMPPGARLGTGSLRRRAQLLSIRPDLRIMDIRGNLDTRLRKAHGSEYDAVVVALAGLRRMGWQDRVTQILPADVCIPAVGQGALAVQCRKGDTRTVRIVSALDHAPTRICVTAERAFLKKLGSGCRTPTAALARLHGKDLILEAMVASPDGNRTVRLRAVGSPTRPEELGSSLADQFLSAPEAGLIVAETFPPNLLPQEHRST